MINLAKKVVVITGAGSGIGRSLAQQLALKGSRLALSDMNADSLAETVASLAYGADVRSYTLNVTNREQVFEHAEQVKRDFGTAHYIINNAGFSVVGTMEHLTIEEIEKQVDVNLWGVIYGTKAFLPLFLEQDEGCVVNISSVFGLVGYPAQGAYNITKFAVRGLTECLWSELEGTGVRAVCVHPGGIKTNIASSSLMCANATDVEDYYFTSTIENLLKTSPEKCAADIISGLERGKRRILTGHKSTTIYWLSRLLPNIYPVLLKWLQ